MKYFLLMGLLWLGLPPVAARAQAVPKVVNTTVASNEVIAVVVHVSNPLEQITMDELHKICTATRRHWSHGGKITLALREPGQPERDLVVRQICDTTEADFTRRFISGTFGGQIQNAPKQLSSSFGVRRFVFHVPGAIGFVRASELDDTVKMLKVEGRRPGEAGYPLVVPTKPPAAR